MASPLRNLKKGLRRLVNAEVVTVDGVTATTDPALVSKEVRNGLFKETYEEPERILIRGALQKGDRVLEVGGGVGFVSVLCSKIVGAENVLTYEANPKMHPVIRKNFELNGLTPNLRSKAITSDGRDVTFFISDNIISSSLIEREGGKAQTIPADALDAVLAEWKPTALVMDAEGAEVDILGQSQLPGLSKMILELHPHIVGEAPIQKLKDHFARLGFREEKAIHKSSYFLRSRE